MSLVYFIAIPLLGSFLMPLYKNNLRLVSVIINVILLGFVFVFSSQIPIKEYISFDSALSITFMLDIASLFFIGLFVSVMLFFSIFNLRDDNNRGMFIVTNIFSVGTFGLVLSVDIFNIYIFFEIASISAYILTSLNRDQKAYAGAIKYMIVGTIASIFLLLAIMIIYLNVGSLNLITISDSFHLPNSNLQYIVLLSLFIGFGIKAEIFPLNFWVVDIYQAVPTKVASLFSAILSKAYLFVFFHIVYILKVDVTFLSFLMGIGILSFAVAEISALRSKDSKRVFTYSTLGQLGVLFLAFASSDIVIISGAIFLILAHSIAKLMLFLSLDIIEEQMHSTKVEIFAKFQSLFLISIFAIGFLSLLGIPPFAGFIAKLTILKGLASLGQYTMVGAILFISLIEATYFFRLLSANITGKKTVEIKVSIFKKVMLSLLAIAIIYLGVFPQEVLGVCTDIAITLIQGVQNV